MEHVNELTDRELAIVENNIRRGVRCSYCAAPQPQPERYSLFERPCRRTPPRLAVVSGGRLLSVCDMSPMIRSELKGEQGSWGISSTCLQSITSANYTTR